MLLRFCAVAALSMMLAACDPVAETSACLSYDDTVTVGGTLRREVHPGAPNFESVAAGDSAEAFFFLRLTHPVCARGLAADSASPDRAPVDSVVVVQLLVDSLGYISLRPKLDSFVEVRGQLLSAHTGHHHAPLLLWREGSQPP